MNTDWNNLSLVEKIIEIVAASSIILFPIMLLVLLEAAYGL